MKPTAPYFVKNFMILSFLIGVSAVIGGTQGPQPYIETIPGSLAEFKMIPIPVGQIEMNGSTHKVGPIFMSQTEVLWDVYDIFAFRLDLTQEQVAMGVDAESRPSKPYGAPDKGFGHQGFAALGVTHHAATLFCKWLSKKTGKTYRLPTEAEWEFAARAGEKSNPEKLEDVAWFWDNADDMAHKAASKSANRFGLHDMLGNVAEWANGVDEPLTCGGHYMSKRNEVGFSAREKQTPKWNQNDPQNPKSKWWLSNAPFIGFRIVCEK